MGVEVAVIGLIISAAGAAYSGHKAMIAGKDAKSAANDAARGEEEAAAAEAASIRDRAQRVKATQRAALAGAGVKLGEAGTGAEILGETDRLSEQDALAVLKEGANRAALLRKQGDQAAATGRSQATASGMNAAGSAVNGASKIRAANAPARTTSAALDGAALTLASRAAPRYSLIDSKTTSQP
jgi:hypothetical protein